MTWNQIKKHLHGPEHSFRHKAICGTFVMFIGVAIAKSASLFDAHVAHYMLDMTGYLVHGVGAIPLIEKYIMD